MVDSRLGGSGVCLLLRIFVILLTVCFASWAAESGGANGDIDNLLKQVDEALAPSPVVRPTEKDVSGTLSAPVVRKRPRKVENEPSPAPQERFTAPLDHSSLAEILSADTASRHADLRSIEQGYLLRVGALLFGLDSGYALSKDDDTFTVQHASLPGLGLTFQPSWYVSELSLATLQTRLTLGMGAAAAYAQGEAVRTGVMSGRDSYSYLLIPVQADVGVLIQWQDYVGAQVSYGYGADLLSQRGRGVTDTTNAIFAADVLSVTFRVLWSAETEMFFTWSKRGLGLLPSHEGLGSYALRAGFGFHLGG